MISLVGFSPFSLRDSDGAESLPPTIDPLAAGPAGGTGTFLSVLMERVAQINGQIALSQRGPASSTARVTDPGSGRSGSGSGAKGSVAVDPHMRRPERRSALSLSMKEAATWRVTRARNHPNTGSFRPPPHGTATAGTCGTCRRPRQRQSTGKYGTSQAAGTYPRDLRSSTSIPI